MALMILFLALTAHSLPVVSYGVLGTLEWSCPPNPQRPAYVDAIVVLAAGIRPPDAIRVKAEMDQDTLYRCLHAAELYHQRAACPIIVSGGKVDAAAPGPAAAELMREFLGKLGVADKDLIVENTSRTTFENAVECRKILESRGLRKIFLVTDAVDAHRALRCFWRQYIDAIPSACHYRATQMKFWYTDFIPSPAAAQNCQRVFHEWWGTFWYWLHGRI
ncbi:MAG: YdcF family protein [Acidobacteria bacterium]|nr:YdcF family protein [Acidobacteriota bacterium]